MSPENKIQKRQGKNDALSHDQDHENQLKQLSLRLGYVFKNMELLQKALTHRSIPGKNNERLEFLGDAVLSFIIASVLFERHPNAREGELSRMRSILVNGEILARFAKELNISPHLRLGMGEMKSGGRHRHSILADALEAIIGAIYMDGGIEECRRCVMNWYGTQFEDLSELEAKKDPKSALQEWLQAKKLPLPDYKVKVSGAPHEQIFHVTCAVTGLSYVTEGVSTSRRRAEQQAAELFLELVFGKY